MPDPARKSIFCISSYEKGQRFLTEAASVGCDVTLLTVDKLADADWPKDILKEFLTMPAEMTPEQILSTVTWLARIRPIDRIVALDEFDVETAALLRDHMQVPGMGQTLVRRFRDKLAMRTEAKKAGIAVPDFTRVLTHADLAAFMRDTPGPWLLKPRLNASAIGIKPISQPDQLWPILDQLGDLQSHYVLERFVAGQVYHCEGVTWNGKVLFAAPCQYGAPPIETMHKGGIFSTRTLALDSPDGRGILDIHSALLTGLGLPAGVTHSEFIKSAADGRFYFLETAVRVGGAYIADTVELATGLNPWVEWARIEVALARGEEYALPQLTPDYAGAVISLARQETPDLSPYTDPEIAYRLHKPHHAGVLLKSPSATRIHELVDSYTQRFLTDFNAVLPAPDKPTA
jgi:biotin carboxylase